MKSLFSSILVMDGEREREYGHLDVNVPVYLRAFVFNSKVQINVLWL